MQSKALLLCLHAACALTLTRRSLGAGVALRPVAAFAAPPQADEAAAVDAALRSFNRGDYGGALEAWRRLTALAPESALYWSNRGTCELILGSNAATLGARPTGEPLRLLEAAVASLERADGLPGPTDALALNNLGNAKAVLLDWPGAALAYDASDAAATAARDRALASLPALNRACVALELGEPEDAARRTATLLRRDPNIIDGHALEAALKYRAGDATGAEAAYAKVCVPGVGSPDGFRAPKPGIGGTEFCEFYASADAVRGRWTPTAVDAYATFLASRDTRARVAANTRPFGELP